MYISLYMYLNELSNTYNVNINFVEYYGIRSAIWNNWKQIILGENIKLDNEIVKKIKALFIQKIQQEPVNCHKIMGKRFRNFCIYSLSKSTKQSLAFKCLTYFGLANL
jgi:hypothetical protein